MDKKKHILGSASYDHVLRYTGLFGGVQVLKKLVEVFRNKLTSELLGPHGAGLLQGYSRITESIHATTNLGLPFSAVKNISEHYEKSDDAYLSLYIKIVRSWSVWIGLVGALICFVASPFLSFVFPEDSDNHTFDICLLSLLVFVLPIEACECSILKGIRQLKCLSKVELLAAVCSLVFSVPFYLLMGVRGIVFVLVLTSWAVTFCHLYFSCKFYKWRLSLFDFHLLKKGTDLVKIGYMLAGIAGSLSSLLLFYVFDDLTFCGLYGAGYTLLVTHVGSLFLVTDADYFPRLSSLSDRKLINKTVNQQIEICILVIVPILIVLSLFLTHIIRLFYSNEFVKVVPMIICATPFLFFKTVMKPIEYLPLAKGHSFVYLTIEIIYDILYFFCVYLGYKFGGAYFDFLFDGLSCGEFVGTGIGMTVAEICSMFIISLSYSLYYGFRFSQKTLLLIFFEFICLSMSIPFCLHGGVRVFKYGFGLTALALSVFLAWHFLSKHTRIVNKLKNKFSRNNECGCCK